MAWGHMRETFDDNCCIFKKHEDYDSIIAQIDDVMDSDKFYAYIEVDIDNKLHIRNLFDSKHYEGFNQKNTYFSDELYYDLFLDDRFNLLDKYLALGNISRDDNIILYLCVEYDPNNKIDLDLLLYCSKLEQIKTNLEDKLQIIEMQNESKLNKSKKTLFSFFY